MIVMTVILPPELPYELGLLLKIYETEWVELPPVVTPVARFLPQVIGRGGGFSLGSQVPTSSFYLNVKYVHVCH